MVQLLHIPSVTLLTLQVLAAVLDASNSCVFPELCYNYQQQCTNRTIYFKSVYGCFVNCFGTQLNVSQVFCYGDCSCTNTNIMTTASTSVVTDDTYYSSCYNATTLTFCDYLDCCSTLSCSNNVTMSFSLKDNILSFFSSTCIFMYEYNIFKSQSSTSSSCTISQSITLYCQGTFDFYNSTVYSNGNDYKLYLQGYYCGYGLNVYCNAYGAYDTCTIYFTGLLCLDTNCINGDTVERNSCTKEYTYDDDLLCLASKDLQLENVSDSTDSIIFYNVSILPTSDKNIFINYIDYGDVCSSSGVCKESLIFNDYISGDKIYNYSLIVNNDYQTNICSQYSNLITTINGNIYCNGYLSCFKISNMNGNDVYCTGSSACGYSTISLKNVLNCQGVLGCDESTSMNGKVLICCGSESCVYSAIINVAIDVVIGLGLFSLEYRTIINESYIYLLGCESGQTLTIENMANNSSLPGIYCQNYQYTCTHTSTKLYCKTETFIQGGITSYIDNCWLELLSPTASPTITISTMVPTMSIPTGFENTDATTKSSPKDGSSNIIGFLSQRTIIIPLMLFVFEMLMNYWKKIQLIELIISTVVEVLAKIQVIFQYYLFYSKFIMFIQILQI